MNQSLSDLMEFDHVIQVHEDGTISEPSNVYAPELYDNELNSTEWELMDGYSGQYGYSGPIMHNSEFIGGQMERDILATPGFYVSLVNYFLDELDEEDAEGYAEGWAIAFKETR